MSYAVTIPDTLEMVVGEKLNLTIDYTGVVAPSDAVSSPVVTVFNAAANEQIPSAIIGSPSFSGKVLSITLDSTNLRSETDYIATFTANVTGGGKISIYLTISVVY